MLKKIIYINLILILFTQTIFADGWVEIKNAPFRDPINGRFESIYFINNQTGWVIDAEGNKLYKSTNSGSNWFTLFSPIYTFNFRSLVFIDSLKGYIGTLDTARPLYKTIDGGISWFEVNSLFGADPQGICGLFKNKNNYLFGCGWYANNATFIKSTNLGEDWISKDLSKYAKGLVDVYFFNNDTGIVVGWNGFTYASSNARAVILYTSNGGDNWTNVYTSLNTGQNCWKISFPTENIGYVSLERFGSPVYYLKTTNKGMSWKENQFLNLNYVEQGIGFINENTGWIGGSRVSTNFSYKTLNGGSNWNPVGILKNINKFLFLNDSTGFAVGRTIYKYDNKKVNISQSNEFLNINSPELISFPNPSNSQIKLNFNLPYNDKIIIKMIDLTGKEIKLIYSGNILSGYKTFNINADDIPSGVYILKLITSFEVVTTKTIIVK